MHILRHLRIYELQAQLCLLLLVNVVVHLLLLLLPQLYADGEPVQLNALGGLVQNVFEKQTDVSQIQIG